MEPELQTDIEKGAGLWPLLRRGMLLAAAAALLGGLLVVGLVVLLAFLAMGAPGSVGALLENVFAWLLVSLAVFIIALIPGIIGGAINALGMYKLSARPGRPRFVELLIGAAVGFVVCSVSFLIGGVWIIARAGPGSDELYLYQAVLTPCMGL
jgi:hypothetical protein